MSHLLEVLGRGMLGRIAGAFGKALGAESGEPLDQLEHLVECSPDDVDARIRLGGAYLSNEDAVSARRIFSDILSRKRPSPIAARIGLACALDQLDRVEQSLEQLRIVQKEDPLNPAVLFCLGFCHERCGREIEAINYYQDALDVCPTLRNARERLAAIFLKQDQLDPAIHHYTELCRLDPQQTELHLTLANLLLKAEDYSEAVRRYEHAVALEPDNWTVHEDAVTAYEKAGLFREAIEHLHDMIEKQPDFADTRLRLGDLYARIGNDDAAMDQYERAVELAPDYLEANVRLATQHLRSGRYEEAARWFAFALELNDRLLSAYVGMGVAQHAGGREAEAMASFESARNIEPNSTLLFSEVSRMHLRAAAVKQADHFLPSCVDVDAGSEEAPDPTIHTDLISEQIERHRNALASRPNHADIHYRLGLLLRNRGQLDDAIACFESAVEINPSYMKALIKLGLALHEAERTDEAIEAFKKAVDLHPEYLDLHYRLGLLFAQKHQFELAVEQFEHAAEGNPGNVEFQANLALALQNMGLIDRAHATWEIVRELDPNSPFAEQAREQLAKQRHDD